MTEVTISNTVKQITITDGGTSKTVEISVPSVTVVTAAVQGLPGINGIDGVMTEPEIRQIAADQDTVQIYDFSALVNSNLGVDL